MADDETFIDPDSQNYGYNNKESYGTILLKQMQRCIDNLSKEWTGGGMKTSQTKTGEQSIYVEDVRELVINSIEAFRILMVPFTSMKNKEEYRNAIENIFNQIDKRWEQLGEVKQMIRGRGEVKVKDQTILEPNNPVWQSFINYKALKYRELFEVLISAYNKSKQDIIDAETE